MQSTEIRQAPIPNVFDEETINSDRCVDAVLDDIDRVGEVQERFESIA